MKPSEFSLTLKSFKQLKTLLEKEAFPFHTSRSPNKRRSEDKAVRLETEEQIFKDAMADVTPLPGNLRAEIEPTAREDGMPRQHLDLSNLSKSLNEVLVLTALAGGARHGYQLAQEVEEQSGGLFKFRHGTLYPILHKLERQKLIKGRWSDEGKRGRVAAPCGRSPELLRRLLLCPRPAPWPRRSLRRCR